MLFLFTMLLPFVCKQQKYVPQMLNIHHMYKWLDMHERGKYANIYTAYELGTINDVARITINRWQQGQLWWQKQCTPIA